MKSDEEWRKELTAEQYQVLRKKDTERPGTGKFYHHKEDGVYVCGGCGQPLFASEDKYDSGCGWPSFSRPAAGGAVEEIKDRSLGMLRTEIVCSRCAGHLGHVFEDGPKPTGLRYCVNSASLGFKKQEAGKGGGTEKATFAAGCFWCVEAVFETQDGVKGVISGYTGGRSKDPTYEQVCSGKTGHAEAIQVEFDPSVISYEKLLDLFWKSHDPTTPNRQGADVGSQYRSAVFYHSTEQKETAERKKAELVRDGVFADPIVTELAPAAEFYEAEEYHQDYFRRNTEAPYCNAVIGPKLKKLGL